MTDIDKFKNLFTEMGIGFFTEKQVKPNPTIEYIFCIYGKEKIQGNHWCSSYFEFDLEGKFISMGAYEE